MAGHTKKAKKLHSKMHLSLSTVYLDIVGLISYFFLKILLILKILTEDLLL